MHVVELEVEITTLELLDVEIATLELEELEDELLCDVAELLVV